MANTNRPGGLIPVRHSNGSPFNGAANTYCIPSTDTNAYAIGDPIVLAGSADARGIPTVTIVTAGGSNPVLGSLIGLFSAAFGATGSGTDQNNTVIPATKTHDYYVMVCDAPDVIFEIQEVGTGTPLAATDVGLNASLVATAGANNTGHNGYSSGWMVDNSTEATTSTLQLKLHGLVPRSDNAFGAYAKWLVTINNHCFRAGTTGI